MVPNDSRGCGLSNTPIVGADASLPTMLARFTRGAAADTQSGSPVGSDRLI